MRTIQRWSAVLAAGLRIARSCMSLRNEVEMPWFQAMPSRIGAFAPAAARQAPALWPSCRRLGQANPTGQGKCFGIRRKAGR